MTEDQRAACKEPWRMVCVGYEMGPVATDSAAHYFALAAYGWEHRAMRLQRWARVAVIAALVVGFVLGLLTHG